MSLILENSLKPSKKIFWKWILLAVVVFGLFAGLLLGIQSVLQEEVVSIVEEPFVETSIIDGSLFLTLAAFNPVISADTLMTVFMNSAGPGMNEMPLFELGDSTVAVAQVNMSPLGSKAVFIGMPMMNEVSQVTEFSGTGVFSVNLEEETKFPKLVELIQTTSLELSKPDDQDYFRQFPVISTYGNVLYSSLSKELYETAGDDIATLDAQAWNIYIVDSEGEKILLTQGLRPKWIHEDNFAFLKNDGVYVYNLETGTEQLVWRVDGGVTVINGFDVANDTSHFVVTEPSLLKVDIVSVPDWKDSSSMLLVDELSMAATNPVISPDNEHIAFLVVRKSETNTPLQTAGVEFYSFETQNLLVDRKIMEDSIGGTHITDWQ